MILSDNNDTENKKSVSNTKKGTKNDINKGQQNNKGTNIKAGKPIKKDKANNNNKADNNKKDNKGNNNSKNDGKYPGYAKPGSDMDKSAHQGKITDEELDQLNYE